MKRLIILILALFLVPNVLGITCSESFGEFKPGDELHYICEEVNATSCYSYVYLNNATGGLINARPLTEVSGFGTVSGFKVTNDVALIDFSTKDLRPEYAYTFGILCGPDQVEFNRTLQHKTLDSGARAGIFLKDNALYIALAFLFGGLVLGVVLYLINAVKYKGMGILDVIDNIFFRRRGGKE